MLLLGALECDRKGLGRQGTFASTAWVFPTSKLGLLSARTKTRAMGIVLQELAELAMQRASCLLSVPLPASETRELRLSVAQAPAHPESGKSGLEPDFAPQACNVISSKHWEETEAQKNMSLGGWVAGSEPEPASGPAPRVCPCPFLVFMSPGAAFTV